MIEGGPELEEELKRRLHEAEIEASRARPLGQAQTFITLLYGIDKLTDSVAKEIAAASISPS
jgi:hypothetical protein